MHKSYRFALLLNKKLIPHKSYQKSHTKDFGSKDNTKITQKLALNEYIFSLPLYSTTYQV